MSRLQKNLEEFDLLVSDDIFPIKMYNNCINIDDDDDHQQQCSSAGSISISTISDIDLLLEARRLPRGKEMIRSKKRKKWSNGISINDDGTRKKSPPSRSSSSSSSPSCLWDVCLDCSDLIL